MRRMLAFALLSLPATAAAQAPSTQREWRRSFRPTSTRRRSADRSSSGGATGIIYETGSGRYAVASFTRQFTAAAILLLEERGKLRLDDPVKKYWQRALYGGKLISPASLAKMTTRSKGDYGLGIYVRTIDGRRIYTHGGGVRTLANLTWYPDTGISVVVLGNAPTVSAPEINHYLGTLAHGAPVVLASRASRCPSTSSRATRAPTTSAARS